MRLYFFFLATLILFSCNDKSSKVQSSAQEKPAAMNKERSGLPGFPKALIEKMLKEVDYIDYIFYKLPISASQDEKNSINSNIFFISPEPAGDIPESCKPIGRKFFNIKGETIIAADVYFSDGCNFYVFLEDEKPIYSSKLSPEGVNFYSSIIKQVK
jgi:hypothetical protein